MQRLAPCVAVLMLAACGDPDRAADGTLRQAIVGGDLDTTDTSVVAVRIHAPSEATMNITCSGSVISPHVVLTAGHCVDPAENGADAVYTINIADDVYASVASQLYTVKETHLDPQFTAGAAGAGSHDVGIVVTDDVLPLAPLPLNTAPLDASLVGTTVRILGYGLSDPAHFDQAHYGKRRQAVVSLTSVVGEFLEFGTADAGTCGGDSGGPMLLGVDGGERIIAFHEAVISASCNSTDRDTRVDTFFLGFIKPTVEAADPGFFDVPDAGSPIADAGAPADAGDMMTEPPHGGCSVTGGALWPCALLLLARRRALRL